MLLQTPGVAEEKFRSANNVDIFSAFFLRWNTSQNLAIPPFIPNEPLPDWITKDELKFYAEAFDKCGWSGGLNHYRATLLYVTSNPFLKRMFVVEGSFKNERLNSDTISSPSKP